MTVNLNVSLAGLRAAQVRARAAAANIANVNTAGRTARGQAERAENPRPPFQPLRVVQTTSPDGVVTARAVAGPVAAISLSRPGHPLSDSEGFVAFPDISLVREVVELSLAAKTFRLNLAMLKSQADLLGDLVDLKS